MRQSLSRLLAILSLIIGLSSTSFAEEKKPEASEKQETVATSLHDLMESIGDDYSILFKAVKNPAEDKAKDKEAALAALERLIKNTAAAKKLTPELVKKIEGEAEHKKMLDAYAKEMDVMIANLEKIKAAVNENKWESALEVIGAMKKHKKESHDKFQEEDEK